MFLGGTPNCRSSHYDNSSLTITRHVIPTATFIKLYDNLAVTRHGSPVKPMKFIGKVLAVKCLFEIHLDLILWRSLSYK